MFNQFPKSRPPLPMEIEKIYSEYYKSNREGLTIASSLARKMDSWLHKIMASDVAYPKDSSKSTLELGAGTLNQLPYEPYCHPYDIVEPFTALYKDSSFLSRIRNVYSDISEIPSNSKYDRITSIGVLEHICDLPVVVAKSGLLLSDRGVYRAGIPNEGKLLWSLSWKLTTGVEFKIRHGLDYELIMKHEHVNTAMEIEEVLEFFFEYVDCKLFGLTKSLSLFRFYECRYPIIEKCIKMLNSKGLEHL